MIYEPQRDYRAPGSDRVVKKKTQSRAGAAVGWAGSAFKARNKSLPYRENRLPKFRQRIETRADALVLEAGGLFNEPLDVRQTRFHGPWQKPWSGPRRPFNDPRPRQWSGAEQATDSFCDVRNRDFFPFFFFLRGATKRPARQKI